MAELWTAAQCAAELGITTNGWRSQVAAGRRARERGETHWAPEPTGFDPGSGLRVWDAGQVLAGVESRPGRGARTDLRTPTAR